jgi:BolA protein
MEQDHLRKSIGEIEKTLKQGLEVHLLQIEDQGHLHQGHEPAKAGKLHLKMLVVSDEFLNLNQIERHQKIYFILTKYLADKLHALSLETYSVDEYNSL